jgi:glycerophosphoryl diester phosphodiesterase
MKKETERVKAPWIVAHRGAMDEAPENTQSAFDRALTHPIDGIELDVQMTKDGELVIYHDETLERIAGTKQRIADLAYADLQRLDWGGWFADDFRGERVLMLASVLDRYAARTRLLVEIKSFDSDQRSGRSLEITKRVLTLLDRRVPAKHDANVLILSFDPRVLAHAGKTTSRWRCVLNIENPPAPLDTHGDFQRLYACCASVKRLEPSVVETWRSHGKTVMTWSCNAPDDVDLALRLKCDVIMTDRLGWIFQYLGGRGSGDAESRGS